MIYRLMPYYYMAGRRALNPWSSDPTYTLRSQQLTGRFFALRKTLNTL